MPELPRQQSGIYEGKWGGSLVSDFRGRQAEKKEETRPRVRVPCFQQPLRRRLRSPQQQRRLRSPQQPCVSTSSAARMPARRGGVAVGKTGDTSRVAMRRPCSILHWTCRRPLYGL